MKLNLFKGGREGDFATMERRPDDFSSDVSPLLANASASDDIFSNWPAIFARLNSLDNLDEKLREHRGPGSPRSDTV